MSKPAGLYTHLLFEKRPEEPRRLPMLYQGMSMNSEEAVRDIAVKAAEAALPLVLNIEKAPGSGGKTNWWVDTVLDTEDDYANAVNYMLTRLRWAQEEGADVALWSRPAQNAMSSIVKPSRHEELLAVYEQRWRDAGPILGRQDFVAIELYLPIGTRPHEYRDWPRAEWIKRGEIFADHARDKGFEPLLYISPTYSGTDGPYVPAQWLYEVVTHFVQRGDPVVIWGAQKKRWDAAEPVCAAIAKLMGVFK